ncbi:hypothetical protein [Luteibacter yeojuensis]|uniref:Uncharacterized protein n=1 Tax=Luteibacter yeojuensis TaxID=345309 RepID=A0A7X5QU14_9GAMM|nr:hypothetical protein [Luteibacter yeojuensis]NID15411.1 hypothetical protein [Luteibacter yeojuensis]
MTKRLHETQVELVRRIAREAQAERQLVVTAFADAFVMLAHTMAAAAFDESNLRIPHPTDGAQYEKDRAHNRQIVDRWLSGKVSEFPVEFVEPWVMALPDASRERALLALFDRYDRLPAKKADPEEGLSCFSAMLGRVAAVTDAMAPIVADGRVDERDQPHLKPALEAVSHLMASLAGIQAQLAGALPDEVPPNVVSMRSAG